MACKNAREVLALYVDLQGGWCSIGGEGREMRGSIPTHTLHNDAWSWVPTARGVVQDWGRGEGMEGDPLRQLPFSSLWTAQAGGIRMLQRYVGHCNVQVTLF